MWKTLRQTRKEFRLKQCWLWKGKFLNLKKKKSSRLPIQHCRTVLLHLTLFFKKNYGILTHHCFGFVLRFHTASKTGKSTWFLHMYLADWHSQHSGFIANLFWGVLITRKQSTPRIANSGWWETSFPLSISNWGVNGGLVKDLESSIIQLQVCRFLMLWPLKRSVRRTTAVPSRINTPGLQTWRFLPPPPTPTLFWWAWAATNSSTVLGGGVCWECRKESKGGFIQKSQIF